MSEKCGVCGRPKGDYHRRPVAGECTAPDPTDYTVSLQCTSIALRKAQEDIAAAEERGRRAVFADPEALARRFHETYERLAPEHGYETRRDSAVPWEKVPEKNRRLMIAVCAALAPRDSGKEG